MSDLSQGISAVETLMAERDLFKRRLASSEECRNNLFAELQRVKRVRECADRWRRAFHHGTREEIDIQEQCLLDALADGDA